MSDAIVIIIIAVLFAIGIREAIKHYHGEGGCCGGSSDKPEKKKLSGKVLYTYTFKIEDMHCKNCVYSVTRAINNIEGAAAEKVSLKKKTATVVCDREIDRDVIKEAIIKRGYEAV